jgi:hypothetical protein
MKNERDEFREIVGDSIVDISAVAIREIARHSVTEILGDAFPRNYVYGVGDYNLVYLAKQQYGDQHHGFAQSADMAALYPDGQIMTGVVSLQVNNWSNWWKFRDASMKPADSIDIVTYGPALLYKLFSQVYSEIEDQEDPEKLGHMLGFLDTELAVCTEAQEFSTNGLKAITGMEKPGLVMGEKEKIPKDIELLMGAIENEFGFKERKQTSAYQAAFELYTNRDQIASEVQHLADDCCIGPLYKKTSEFIRALQASDLFPNYNFSAENQEWYPDKSTQNHACKIAPRSLRSKPDSWWVVSRGGDIREATSENGSVTLRYNPVSIIRSAPDIVVYLINTVVRDTFPKLKTDY